MDVVRRGVNEQHLSFKEWRARVLRSQTIFPEIRYIPELKSEIEPVNPLSVAQGIFFNRKDEIGKERLNEASTRDSAA